MKILIAEDTKEQMETYELAFGEKHKLIKAKDGKEALHLFNKNQDVDFVISDYDMPYLNGGSFINYVKTIDSNIPILLVTSRTLLDYNILAILKKFKNMNVEYIYKNSEINYIEQIKAKMEAINGNKSTRKVP